MTIKSYPQSTTNPNVPPDVYLLAEVILTSGEVTETSYITRDGDMFTVCNWVDRKPYPLYMNQACKLTLDTEQMIYHRWESWFRLHPKAQDTTPEVKPKPPHRTCAKCGTDQYRKKVWAWHGKKVLCMTCGQKYAFWIDGTLYDITVGASQEQKAQLRTK